MKKPLSHRFKTVASLLFAGLILIPVVGCAADPVASAEAAVARFRVACDGEIKRAVSPETMARINAMREAPYLMIARKSHQDLVEFSDPKTLADASRNDLFGSHSAVTKSTGDVWVLTYDNMKGLAVYLDAASGAVLCVAFVPEG